MKHTSSVIKVDLSQNFYAPTKIDNYTFIFVVFVERQISTAPPKL